MLLLAVDRDIVDEAPATGPGPAAARPRAGQQPAASASMLLLVWLLSAFHDIACALQAPPDIHITADIPSLVALSHDTTSYNKSQPMTGEFGPWFPQTMHVHPSGALLLSYQTDADTLNEDGWTGQHYDSIDGGHTWYPIDMALSPLHVKPCVPQVDGSLLCMEYAMRRTASPHLGAKNATFCAIYK